MNALKFTILLAFTFSASTLAFTNQHSETKATIGRGEFDLGEDEKDRRKFLKEQIKSSEEIIH